MTSSVRLSDNFEDDEPYGFLLHMVKEEESFWSSMKICYREKRDYIKAQNVSIMTKSLANIIINASYRFL